MGWPGLVTHRQHNALLAYEDAQWNQPDRTDWQLAAIAMEVRRVPYAVWGRTPQMTLSDFLLKFAGEKDKPLSEERQRQLDEMSKARWRAFLGKGQKNSTGSES